MSLLILVVDDEPDVGALFRQQFRRDLVRKTRFVMDFAALGGGGRAIADRRPIEQSLILILSDINMPGMTGLEMLPKVKGVRPDVPIIMITAYGDPCSAKTDIAHSYNSTPRPSEGWRGDDALSRMIEGIAYPKR